MFFLIFCNVMLFLGSGTLYGAEQTLVTIQLQDGESKISKEFLMQHSVTMKDSFNDASQVSEDSSEAPKIDLPFTIQQFDDWCRCCKVAQNTPRRRKFERIYSRDLRVDKCLWEETVDVLVTVARVSMYLNSEALLKGCVRALLHKLEDKATCNELIAKLEENPEYLPSDLANTIRRKIIAGNGKLQTLLFKKFLLPLSRLKGDLTQEKLICSCPYLFDSDPSKNCLMFYHQIHHHIRLVNLKTGEDLGTLEPLFGKSFSHIDFNYAIQTFVCVTGTKIYIAQLQEDFKGSIINARKRSVAYYLNPPIRDTPSIDLKTDIGEQNICVTSAVCWHPTQAGLLAVVQQFKHELYESVLFTRVAIIDVQKQKYVQWKPNGGFLGSLAWSQDGNYLAISRQDQLNCTPLHFAEPAYWLELYDISTLNWETKEEPKKKMVEIHASSIHSFAVGKKQFFAVGSESFVPPTKRRISLLHMSDGKLYLTPLCENISSSVRSLATAGQHNQTLLLHTADGQMYQVNLEQIDDLYLHYLRQLRALPLRLILLLLHDSSNKEAISTIQAIEHEYNLKKIESFMNRFSLKNIGYGIFGLTSSCLAGWLLYKTIQSFDRSSVVLSP